MRVFTTDVGEKRLLGIGAGGLALMATLDDEEIAAILQRHALEYEKAGFDRLRMMQAVQNTRQQNFASICGTITEGVSGVGCALKVSTSHWASISFGAITPRLPQARQQELGELLAHELLQF